jgi:dienelactone hydrolase
VIEREVIVETDSFKMGGTLMVPKGAVHPPVVVFVAGSGPTDRDETIKSNKDFEDIAYALANYGIASLRYDKRTLIYGNHAAGMPEDLTPKQEVVDDALSALILARQFPEVNATRVFVLGHSLGAMFAPRIAQLDAHLAGVIMLAAPARPFEDIVLDQMEYLLPQQMPKERAEKTLTEVRAMVTRVKQHHYSDTTASSFLFDLPPKYWDYLRLYDQVKTASILAEPMLIMQGDKDYQVSTKEYDLWKQGLGGKKNVTFMMFPGLYHSFMPGKGTYTDYDTPSHVPEDVTSTIAKWILEH